MLWTTLQYTLHHYYTIIHQIKKAGYLPEGVEETIPQITNKLSADMLQFRQLFDSKYSAEEELEKERNGTAM